MGPLSPLPLLTRQRQLMQQQQRLQLRIHQILLQLQLNRCQQIHQVNVVLLPKDLSVLQRTFFSSCCHLTADPINLKSHSASDTSEPDSSSSSSDCLRHACSCSHCASLCDPSPSPRAIPPSPSSPPSLSDS